MIKFSSLFSQGIEVRKVKGKYGETITVYWRWPWDRPDTLKYRVVVADSVGGLFQDYCGNNVDILLEGVDTLHGYCGGITPHVDANGVYAIAFSLKNSLRDYFAKRLPDGEYLVFIAPSFEQGRTFWKKRGWKEVWEDSMILDVSDTQARIEDLVRLQRTFQEGRYFRVEVRNGYIHPVTEIL